MREPVAISSAGIRLGAHVQKGQLLAEIETPEVDRQLEQARADLDTRKLPEHSKITRPAAGLVSNGSVSKTGNPQAVSNLSAVKSAADPAPPTCGVSNSCNR